MNSCQYLTMSIAVSQILFRMIVELTSKESVADVSSPDADVPSVTIESASGTLPVEKPAIRECGVPEDSTQFCKPDVGSGLHSCLVSGQKLSVWCC